MPGFPVPFIKFREDDANGFPLAAGKLWSFAAGTTTPLATYTTQALTPGTENLNPTILDASGRAQIWIEDGVGYKFILMDALDNIIWTVDNVQVPEIIPPDPPSEVPVGGIVMYGGTVAPSGWLLCDGAAVSRQTYNDLWLVIGETYGAGNGGTTFQVPDFRQRFALGLAVSGTGSILGLAGVGGAIDHTHTGPSHTHPIASHVHTVPAHTHNLPAVGWGKVGPTNPDTSETMLVGSGAGINNYQATGNTSVASAVTDTGGIALTTDAGGTAVTGTANPPFLTVNFVIKT
jgi:microcystin-dependent protein